MVPMKKLNCFWTLCLWLLVSKLSKTLGKSLKVPSISDQKFIQEIVDSHNELRSKVNPPAANMNHLYWDKKLAKVAESWSKNCKFAHNPCINKRQGCIKDYDVLGENIFLGGVQTPPKRMISYWYNETQYYDFETMACSKVCGHYTQVVWANSLRIGCAISNCPNLGSSTGLFVCNYSPPGNYRDTKPYIKGESCSKCPTSDCKDNLCRHNIGGAAQQRACHLLMLGFILHRIL
ncbi:GLIPR1-like protein 1 isoform X1 [Peromyscus leucopus]|uniref:GLIPR1-like protein 1 isoform X1 n=1 Tax=Peromyscus leucopus TaxID=10041 RepID=UPI0010A1C950|nr:GLIPR1-like protein 1 isoform X1 [Peromyscus leucopus]